MTNNNLEFILDRIAKNQHTEVDISALRKALGVADNRLVVQQLGKYNVNIGEGKEIHIGDHP